MVDLADCYQKGEGVPQDLGKAVERCQKAYELHGGSAGAAASLCGRILQKAGKDEEAVAWLQKGVKEDDLSAYRDLAHCYRIGKGVAQDEEKAEQLDRMRDKAFYHSIS